MTRALVTGAAGFVGANLARRLVDAGIETGAIVRASSDIWRLRSIESEIELHRLDLCDSSAVESVVRATAPDWVFHFATHGAYSWQQDRRQIVRSNVDATANLVEACLAAGCEAFVYAGSSSEYGLKDHPPTEEEWLDPGSAYAAGKAFGTHYCRYAANVHGLPAVTLRLYSAFGPYEEPGRLVPTLLVHALEGLLPPLADADTARDFVYVADIVEAALRAAEQAAIVAGRVYNVGSGRQTTLREIVDTVRQLFEIDREPEWNTMAPRMWDTTVWVADPTRIQSELAWEPTTSLQDGLVATADWLRADAAARARYGGEHGHSSASR